MKPPWWMPSVTGTWRAPAWMFSAGNRSPPDHPILTCDQVALTPHAADQTPEGVELLNEGAVANVIAFLEGRPNNVVT